MNKEWYNKLDYLMNKTTQGLHTIYFLSKGDEYDLMAEHEKLDSYKVGLEKVSLAYLETAKLSHKKWNDEFTESTFLDEDVIDALKNLTDKTIVNELFYAYNKAACINDIITLNDKDCIKYYESESKVDSLLVLAQAERHLLGEATPQSVSE